MYENEVVGIIIRANYDLAIAARFRSDGNSERSLLNSMQSLTLA